MQAPAPLSFRVQAARCGLVARHWPGAGADARLPGRSGHRFPRKTVWVLQGREDHPVQSAGAPLYGLSLALPCPPSRPPDGMLSRRPPGRQVTGSFFSEDAGKGRQDTDPMDELPSVEDGRRHCT